MFFKKDWINYSIICIISLILVLDLFLHKGEPATVDAQIHITTIAQFSRALASGDFPVLWTDGFANYGLPIAFFAHQLPNYIGTVLSYFTNDYILAYNLLLLISVALSGLFFYKFLKLYFTPSLSLLGTVIFTFAPYKILNIYVRGAMPEVFSSIFIPIILILLHSLVNKKTLTTVLLLTISFALLVLTHPMLFVIYMFIFIPYFIFLLLEKATFTSIRACIKSVDKKAVVMFVTAVLLSLGIAAFYVIPLQLETKYFVYSQNKLQISDQYLSWSNFFRNQWPYYYKGDIITRGNVVQTGIVEFMSLIIGFVYIFYKWLIRKERTVTILEYAVITGLFLLFFTTQFSKFFYENIKILAAVQFPWRMLSAFMTIPPLIFLYIFRKMNNTILIAVIMIAFSLQYIPQLYGKNYTLHSNGYYLFTPYNLHGHDKNTIWMGKPESYPIKTKKYDVIEGSADIAQSVIKNSSREYTVNAVTDIRMIDYTFYFPGWKVYIDGIPTTIEFQDPNYRGVITYKVPQGSHNIVVKLEDTKIRSVSKIISLISVGITAGLFILLRKKKLNKN